MFTQVNYHIHGGTMRSSIFFLEKVLDQERGKIANDSQLAAFLGISRQSMSGHRNNGKSLAVRTAVRVAEVLSVDPMEIICCVMFEQAKKQDDKKFWKLNYEKYKST